MKYKDIQDKFPDLFSNKDALLKIITDEHEIHNWLEEQKLIFKKSGKSEKLSEIGVVFCNPYITILNDLVRFPSGNYGTYFRIFNSSDLFGGKASVVLPIFNGKIILLRQFRHSTRQWHWEVPRGFGEPGISAEKNAIKEIYEEIEGEILKISSLGPFHNNTGVEGGAVELFIAHLKSFGHPNKEEGIEQIKMFEVEEVENMIRDAKITDGFTIAVYYRAKLKKII